MLTCFNSCFVLQKPRRFTFYLFLEMLYVNKSFVLLVHKISQYQVTYRTVPHGTVRKVRLVHIFITRTNVPYPYLSNNYVPYKRTVLFAEKWNVPYCTAILDQHYTRSKTGYELSTTILLLSWNDQFNSFCNVIYFLID